MSKKLLAVSLCLALSLTMLNGCGNATGTQTTAAAAATTAAAAKATSAATTAAATTAAAKAATTAAAAATTAASKTAGSGKYSLVFSLKTVTDDAFQSSIAKAVEDECNAKGIQFKLSTAGSETDVATQVTQIEDAITSGVSALVVNPMDASSVLPALQKAKDAGIPVVLVDSSVASGNESLYITYIGTDNYNAAKQGAQKLTEAMGNKGNVLLVRGANGNAVGEARAKGFKEGLGDGMKLVGEQPGDWSNDTAKQVVEDMLQANPDVSGIMSCSDVMVNGIIEACQDNGKTPGKDVQIMSFDGDSIDLIKQGKVLGTMAQFPKVMGKEAVDTLYDVLTGAKKASDYKPYTDSGTICYTKENADQAK